MVGDVKTVLLTLIRVLLHHIQRSMSAVSAGSTRSRTSNNCASNRNNVTLLAVKVLLALTRRSLQYATAIHNTSSNACSNVSGNSSSKRSGFVLVFCFWLRNSLDSSCAARAQSMGQASPGRSASPWTLVSWQHGGNCLHDRDTSRRALKTSQNILEASIVGQFSHFGLSHSLGPSSNCEAEIFPFRSFFARRSFQWEEGKGEM